MLELILDSAPPLLAVGALRRFADPRAVVGPAAEGEDARLPGLLRELWAAVLEWARRNQQRAGEILPAIGTWASHPGLVEALGPEWMLTRLDSVVRAHGALDVPDGLFPSLTVLVECSPEHAESVADLVLLLRETGLLRPHHDQGLARLVDALAAVPSAPASVPGLRSALEADRVLGPLA